MHGERIYAQPGTPRGWYVPGGEVAVITVRPEASGGAFRPRLAGLPLPGVQRPPSHVADSGVPQTGDGIINARRALSARTAHDAKL